MVGVMVIMVSINCYCSLIVVYYSRFLFLAVKELVGIKPVHHHHHHHHHHILYFILMGESKFCLFFSVL